MELPAGLTAAEKLSVTASGGLFSISLLAGEEEPNCQTEL